MPAIPPPRQWARTERTPAGALVFWDRVARRTRWEETTLGASLHEPYPALHLFRWGRARSREVWALNATLTLLRGWGWRVPIGGLQRIAPLHRSPLFPADRVQAVWNRAWGQWQDSLDRTMMHWQGYRHGQMVWSLTPILGIPRRISGSPAEAWAVRSITRFHWRAGLETDGSTRLLFGLLPHEEARRLRDVTLWNRLTRFQDDEGRTQFHGLPDGDFAPGRPYSLWRERFEAGLPNRAPRLEEALQALLIPGPLPVPEEQIVEGSMRIKG